MVNSNCRSYQRQSPLKHKVLISASGSEISTSRGDGQWNFLTNMATSPDEFLSVNCQKVKNSNTTAQKQGPHDTILYYLFSPGFDSNIGNDRKSIYARTFQRILSKFINTGSLN